MQAAEEALDDDLRAELQALDPHQACGSMNETCRGRAALSRPVEAGKR